MAVSLNLPTGPFDLFPGLRHKKVEREIERKIKEKLGLPVKREPTTIEKVKTIFSDTKTEGHKAGYSKAAEEYHSAYSDLKKMYDTYRAYLDEARESSNQRVESALKELEEVRDRLQSEVARRSTKCEERYSLPAGTVTNALARRGETGHRFYCSGPSLSECILSMPGVNLNIIDVLYKAKEEQRKKAEKQGYLEAKETFEEKLQIMRDDFANLKSEGDQEINEYVDLINDILEDIAVARAQLAELKALE